MEIEDYIKSEQLKKIVLSHPLNKKAAINRVDIRPLLIKGKKLLQISEQTGAQVFHKNVSLEEGIDYVKNGLKNLFREAHFFIDERDYHVWLKKDGSFTVNISFAKTKVDTCHNRKKNYLLEEGISYPFFVALGVMDDKGRIFPEKRDKFRQVNRFLEIASDAISSLNNAKIRIIDLGCGKAYLTFALYHFLRVICAKDVEIIGIDLKKEVISSLNKISTECGYDGLKFQYGSIESSHIEGGVDVVIALHACDVATDSAIAKAVHLQAKIILVAPCCQHELFNQIESPSLGPLLKIGLLKERFAALATDACRAILLEMHGYKTQILEFVDPQHTPKNLLIRAVKTTSSQNREILRQEYEMFKKTLHIFPNLEKLIP